MNIRKKPQQQLEDDTKTISRFGSLFFLSKYTIEDITLALCNPKENEDFHRNFLLWFRTYFKSYSIFKHNQKTHTKEDTTISNPTTTIFVSRKKTEFFGEYINRAHIWSDHFKVNNEPVEYWVVDSILIWTRDWDGLTPEDPQPIYCQWEQTKIYTINTKWYIWEIKSKPRLLNSINQYINHNILEYMYEWFNSIRCHNFGFGIGLWNYSHIIPYDNQKLRIGDTIAFIAPSDWDYHFLVYLWDNIAIWKLAQLGIHFSSLWQSFTKNKMPNSWIIKPDTRYNKLMKKNDMEWLNSLFITNFNLWIEFLNQLKNHTKTTPQNNSDTQLPAQD